MLDPNVLQGPIFANSVHVINLLKHVKAFDHLAEDCVHVSELFNLLAITFQNDEEGACVAVSHLICRGYKTLLVKLARPDLIFKVSVITVNRLFF